LKGQFGFYLAGLIESDGCIVVPKSFRSPSLGPNGHLSKGLSVFIQGNDIFRIRKTKGKIYYPSIQVAFNIKDYPLAVIIKQIIGHGSIQNYEARGACILYINNAQGIQVVVNFINGKMRTPKIEALHRLITYLNKKDSEQPIPLLGIDETCLFSNAWLAGFVEGDGYFYVSIPSSSLERGKGVVTPRLSIEQKENRTSTGESNGGFMLKIAQTFEGILTHRDRGAIKGSSYTVLIAKMSSMLLVMSYFSLFPLFSSKRLNYFDWKAVIEMVQNREQFTPEGFLKIKAKKDSMNNRRTEFNWDFLTRDNFYQQ
jgi:hypothetical protein